jgi:uncharacterized protein YbaP (TraB family)
MHVKSKRVFTAFDQICAYINLCDAFCLEIDMAMAQDPEMQSRMMIPDGQSLTTLLKPKTYKRLEKIIANLGGPPIEHLAHARPMNLISFMSSLIMEEDEQSILDSSLYQYAQTQGKRTFGVESKEEHIAILDKLSLDLEVKQLCAIIQHFSSFKRTHAKMMDHYIHGRIDKLYLNGKKSLGSWRKMLLKDRNFKISHRLVDLSKTESIFCAIGAGHLSGKYGVLRLLKLRGAKLKPVPLTFS